MVDRQDIDALMMGALYGELSPAEQARLDAHLESHPSDRSALDDLRSAREAVRESQIFDEQAEPPQAISALLLQEAHRRAPKRVERDDARPEGWFARLVRSFMLHPAMAAAATLVLVVGVAGALYLKNGGDGFVAKTAAPPAPTAGAPASSSASAEPQAVPPAAQAAAGSASGFDVGLAEGQVAGRADGKEKAPAKNNENLDKARAASDQNQAFATDKLKTASHHDDRGKVSEKPSRMEGGIIVDRPQPAPKDMTGEAASADDETGGFATPPPSANVGAAQAGVAPSGPASGGGTGAPGMAPPAPPPPAPAEPRAPVATTPPATHGAAHAPASERAAPTKSAAPARRAEPITWAKSQHSLAIEQTAAGHCPEAAQLVLAIEARAPAYYAQYVETDRALKPCMSYILGARERRMETERAKASTVKATDSK